MSKGKKEVKSSLITSFFSVSPHKTQDFHASIHFHILHTGQNVQYKPAHALRSKRPGSEVLHWSETGDPGALKMWFMSLPCQRKLVSHFKFASGRRARGRVRWWNRRNPPLWREEGGWQILLSNPRLLLSCGLVSLSWQTMATWSQRPGITAVIKHEYIVSKKATFANLCNYK